MISNVFLIIFVNWNLPMKRISVCIIFVILFFPACREKQAEQADYLRLTSDLSVERTDPDNVRAVIDVLKSEEALAGALDILEREVSSESNRPILKALLLHTLSQCQAMLDHPDSIRTEQESLAILYEIAQKEEGMRTKQAQVAILRNVTFCLILLLLVVAVALQVVLISKKQLSEKNQALYETVQQLTAREEAAIATLQYEPEEELSPRQKLFKRICTLMQEERPYTNSQLKREDLARMLATNYNNVADAIRECSNGQTLGEFLDGFRLKHAARLLARPDEPIGLISEMSGFQSRGHFNALFREKYKMTPSEYRKVILEAGSV